MANILGLPVNKIEAEVIRLGGGFGGKEVRPECFELESSGDDKADPVGLFAAFAKE